MEKIQEAKKINHSYWVGKKKEHLLAGDFLRFDGWGLLKVVNFLDGKDKLILIIRPKSRTQYSIRRLPPSLEVKAVAFSYKADITIPYEQLDTSLDLFEGV